MTWNSPHRLGWSWTHGDPLACASRVLRLKARLDSLYKNKQAHLSDYYLSLLFIFNKCEMIYTQKRSCSKINLLSVNVRPVCLFYRRAFPGRHKNLSDVKASWVESLRSSALDVDFRPRARSLGREGTLASAIPDGHIPLVKRKGQWLYVPGLGTGDKEQYAFVIFPGWPHSKTGHKWYLKAQPFCLPSDTVGSSSSPELLTFGGWRHLEFNLSFTSTVFYYCYYLIFLLIGAWPACVCLPCVCCRP